MRFSLSVSVEKKLHRHTLKTIFGFVRETHYSACVCEAAVACFRTLSIPFCFLFSTVPTDPKTTNSPSDRVLFVVLVCSLQFCVFHFLVVFSFFVVVLWTVFVCRTVRCRKSFFGVDLSINRKSLFEWSEKAFGPQCNQERTAYWLCLSLFLALV